LIVETKSKSVEINNDSNTTKILGLNPLIDFKFSSIANIRNVRNPNFKSTIYWNPRTIVDENGFGLIEFITTDDAGLVRVFIEGVTEHGIPFSTFKDFVVEK
jgi:hypothetical protein